MKARKFEKGDVVALHCTYPSSVGYNGVIVIVELYRYNERNDEWMYCCSSKYGTGSVWAYEHEMIRQN